MQIIHVVQYKCYSKNKKLRTIASLILTMHNYTREIKLAHVLLFYSEI